MELLVGLGFDRILIDFFVLTVVLCDENIFPVYVVCIKSVPEIETSMVVFVDHNFRFVTVSMMLITKISSNFVNFVLFARISNGKKRIQDN